MSYTDITDLDIPDNWSHFQFAGGTLFVRPRRDGQPELIITTDTYHGGISRYTTEHIDPTGNQTQLFDGDGPASRRKQLEHVQELLNNPPKPQ